jgi:hypothetical protein
LNVSTIAKRFLSLSLSLIHTLWFSGTNYIQDPMSFFMLWWFHKVCWKLDYNAPGAAADLVVFQAEWMTHGYRQVLESQAKKPKKKRKCV